MKGLHSLSTFAILLTEEWRGQGNLNDQSWEFILHFLYIFVILETGLCWCMSCMFFWIMNESNIFVICMLCRPSLVDIGWMEYTVVSFILYIYGEDH